MAYNKGIIVALGALALACCSGRRDSGDPETGHTESALTTATRLYLHADTGALALVSAASTGTTPSVADSGKTRLFGDNPWIDVGTWTGAPALTRGALQALTAQLWLGLDIVGDRNGFYDLRLEVTKNGTVAATQDQLCIGGLSADSGSATLVTAQFGSFPEVSYDGTADVLALHVETRIGTDQTGALCNGHRRHTQGLHLYFDSADRASSLDATFALNQGPRWVVVSCDFSAPGVPISTMVDSYGGSYRAPFPFSAGAPLPIPAPPPISQLSPSDLAALLAAAATLQTTSAGYVTTVGPNTHNNTHTGYLYSAGAAGPSKLVESYVDSLASGHRTIVRLDDPAAAVLQRYNCFATD